MRTPEHPVAAYARDVVEGRIIAGRLVRLAAERHLRDLTELIPKGYRFSAEHADHALEFFPTYLRFYDGERAGEPFVLGPAWVFIVGSLFGWLGPDGYRRFQQAYIEMGKGSGKSPTLAGLSLYGAACDGEHGAQILIAAVTREQAGGPGSLFADAKNMAEASPALRDVLVIGEHNIAHPESKSFIRPVSSEGRSLDSKRVHYALLDEIHEHRTAVVVDKLRLGFKGRRQPLQVEITNSGYDRTSVCWQHHDLSRRILEAVEKNERWFAYVCQLDPCEPCRADGKETPQEGCPACDDWREEKHFIKANPNLDISVTREYLREAVRQAVQMPAMQNLVRRLNFCQWTESATRWFTAEQWAACAAPVDPLRLRGRRCVLGVDMATTIDLASVVALFPDDDFFAELTPSADGEAGAVEVSLHGGVDVLAWFFCPEVGVRQRSRVDRAPYELWVKQKTLQATPGSAIDWRRIRARIKALRDVDGYDIAEICYDPAYFIQHAIQLQDEDGFTCVPVSQGFASLTEPSALLEALVLNRGLRHGGNAPLAWCAANVVCETDSGERKRPSKGKSTERIDGISALVTGLKRLVAVARPTSIYEREGRGLIVV